MLGSCAALCWKWPQESFAGITESSLQYNKEQTECLGLSWHDPAASWRHLALLCSLYAVLGPWGCLHAELPPVPHRQSPDNCWLAITL